MHNGGIKGNFAEGGGKVPPPLSLLIQTENFLNSATCSEMH